MSMKNSIGTFGNRTRHLPACSAVPQPTAPPRAPFSRHCLAKKWKVHVTKVKSCPLIVTQRRLGTWGGGRGELSYLAPLGSENISAPYFKQCFFRRGVYSPPPSDRVKHHASQSQDRNNKYFILYIEFSSIIKFKM